jgi:hypothetical protein
LAPPPDPTSAASAAPPPSGAPVSACETVIISGHWQTRVYPDGQRMTVWVPTSSRFVCR